MLLNNFFCRLTYCLDFWCIKTDTLQIVWSLFLLLYTWCLILFTLVQFCLPCLCGYFFSTLQIEKAKLVKKALFHFKRCKLSAFLYERTVHLSLPTSTYFHINPSSFRNWLKARRSKKPGHLISLSDKLIMFFQFTIKLFWCSIDISPVALYLLLFSEFSDFSDLSLWS